MLDETDAPIGGSAHKLRAPPKERLERAFRRTLQNLIEAIRADAATWTAPCSILLTGSLSGTDYDHLSDVDLLIVARGDQDIPALLAEYSTCLSHVGAILAYYSASHLGLPNLWITLIKVGNLVVKVDAEFGTKGNLAANAGARFLHNRLGLTQKDITSECGTAGQQNSIASDDVAVGWLWYTFTKVVRGELFQSASAIDYTRKNYILRLVGQVENVELEDYRRLENRVSKEMLGRLRATYPSFLTKKELCRALFAEANVMVWLLNQLGKSELAQRVVTITALMQRFADELLSKK